MYLIDQEQLRKIHQDGYPLENFKVNAEIIKLTSKESHNMNYLSIIFTELYFILLDLWNIYISWTKNKWLFRKKIIIFQISLLIFIRLQKA